MGINSVVENNRMLVIKIAFIVVISVNISSAARAPDASDPVNFNAFSGQQFPVLSGINTASTEIRDGRQSVLGCLKELRPVYLSGEVSCLPLKLEGGDLSLLLDG